MNNGRNLPPTKAAKEEGWACQGQFHQSVKPLAGFLTLPPTGFGKLNFRPISQEAVPVLHIKNYALSCRITCLCWACIEHFTCFAGFMPSGWGVHEITRPCAFWPWGPIILGIPQPGLIYYPTHNQYPMPLIHNITYVTNRFLCPIQALLHVFSYMGQALLLVLCISILMPSSSNRMACSLYFGWSSKLL